METETFFVGLARRGQEISGKGYYRCRLVMMYRPATDDYANAEAVTYLPAMWPYGFIDMLALATSRDGPSVAMSPLILPINIATGDSFHSAPGFIVMTRKSLAAIKAIRPVNISA